MEKGKKQKQTLDKNKILLIDNINNDGFIVLIN